MPKKVTNLINPKNTKKTYLLLLSAAAVLYIATCAPGPLWQDSGRYQYRILQNDIEGNFGLALAHPLYHIIGIAVKQIPLGQPAYRINLISAIAGALTVANLYLLLRLWFGSNLPALIAAITLMLSHTLWRFSAIAETYTLYTTLFSAELIMLLQFTKTKRPLYLYLLALFNGLAIADHMWAVIPLLCYIVYLALLTYKKQIKPKNLALIILIWLIAAAPYEYLIIKNIYNTGQISSTFASALFGSSWQNSVLNTSLSFKIITENLILIAYNFATLNALFFFVGLFVINKKAPSKSFRNIILAMLILFFLFAFRYKVPDRYSFFIPFYFLAAVLMGLGFDFIITLIKKKIISSAFFVLALMPIPIYSITPWLAEKQNLQINTKRTIPFRNDYKWFLAPWKNNCTGPENFANKALNIPKKNAIIYADSTTAPPLLYLQIVKAKRKDIDIISGFTKNKSLLPSNNSELKTLTKNRPLYVVSPTPGYCPTVLLKNCSFEKKSVIWKVSAKKK